MKSAYLSRLILALLMLFYFNIVIVNSHRTSLQGPLVTEIRDPLAVEPWSVEVNNAEAIVTNYGSDNITVINRANNAIQNIAVGDGPGGTPDGPFGVASGGGGFETYVTLFGSNTIPKKGAPTDYSSVGPGRVQVLTRQSDGTYSPLTLISVGKGPRFPALFITRCKLYVPCGGADRVDVIDIGRNQKIKEIAVGRDPSSCTLSVDGSKLYVTNFEDGTISVIDTNTDIKIKDIPAPFVVMPGDAPDALAQYPWSAALSGANGNLYVTYRGTQGSANSNGVVVEIDTCSDSVIRSIVDDSTAATADGGPFGIVSCRPGLFFTNDNLGIVGLIDARIGRVISPLPSGIASCPKPRGIDSLLVPGAPPSLTVDCLSYVACGAPDNAVLIIRTPVLPENLPDVPLVTSFDYGDKITIRGRGFLPGVRVEAIVGGTPTCLTFEKKPKLKKDGTVLVQKGKLTNGRKLDPDRNEDDEFILFRVVNPNGSTRLIILSPVQAVRQCPN